MRKGCAFLLVVGLLAAPVAARAEVDEVSIPKGAGGVGFLPLLVMEKLGLVEKHARSAGLDGLKVRWVNLGGPAVVNDALLSGAAHLAPAGPPAFLTMWGRTRDSMKVMGVAAMSSIPMYLNTRSERVRSIKDVGASDKIAVTAVKVSIPAIIMQIYARQEYGASEFARFDRYTVSMTHPDGVIALLSGRHEINLHFTSPPFHQRERKDPGIRTIMTTDQVMGGPSTFTMLYTTTAFHDGNPKVYRALLKALEESVATIRADRRAAARIFLESTDGKGWTEDEIVAVLEDPDVQFTTSPRNVMKYAAFMNEVGTLKVRPSSWKDLFFPEIHGVEGN